jgi:hypothetical protein
MQTSFQRLNGGSDGHVTSLYYNDLRPEYNERDLRIAISCTKDSTVDVPERPPSLSGQLPDVCRSGGGDWFYSHATLESVQSIDICRNKIDGNCLGILLHYNDGTREVLGQWRFDYVIEVGKQGIPHLVHFQLGFIRGNPCIKDIRFNSQVEQPDWMTIDMRGYLEWWTSQFGGFVVQK